ncbi:alpha-tocopherol transfer protein [Danaus plexippus plexippus]|uniref:Alpha-tocopherol transfer protein n=1 Tax=Danaus plexippus plexippus TaxID=278856 RepID=A0A212F264_DANPL|nr:alpha-tocopherol transfer protein [Danaus plexippus plexippus]
MSGVIQQFPVEKEYEKNPDISPEDVRKLREWMKTQPHLPEQHWTDYGWKIKIAINSKTYECILVKLKEVHFTNAPYFIDKLLNILKPFIKNELMQNLYIHKRDSEDLYTFVQKETLSKECAGEYKDLLTLKDNEIRRLQDNREFFVRENLRRVDESLRPNGKTNTIEDVFGIQGSFKKFDID